MEEPLEIERRYLVRMPDRAALDRLCAEKLDITQVYLASGPESGSRRVRRARAGGGVRFWYTEKRRVTDLTRVEREREIPPAEYEELLTEADPERRPIVKERWRVPYAGRTLEIDVFPFWTRQAFCEVELPSEDVAPELPPWLSVLREVTSDHRYTNSSLAREIPPEDDENEIRTGNNMPFKPQQPPGHRPPPDGKPPLGMPSFAPPGGEMDGPPPEMPPAETGWIRRKYLDLAYGGDSPAQKLDLYLPNEGAGPFPLLMLIHGGGFFLGQKGEGRCGTFLPCLKRGMAFADINYRLSGEASFPAAALDCRKAVRFLRQHAAEYGLDPSRIAAAGHSAGANLTELLAMNIPDGSFCGESGPEGDCSIRTAVAWFGPTDFTRMDAQARANGVSFVNHDDPASAESVYIGAPVQEAKELCRLADPATYVGERMVARLLVEHGTADRLVPYEQSALLADAVRARLGDGRLELVTLEGADHEDERYGSEENMALVWEFLARNL